MRRVEHRPGRAGKNVYLREKRRHYVNERPDRCTVRCRAPGRDGQLAAERRHDPRRHRPQRAQPHASRSARTSERLLGPHLARRAVEPSAMTTFNRSLSVIHSATAPAPSGGRLVGGWSIWARRRGRVEHGSCMTAIQEYLKAQVASSEPTPACPRAMRQEFPTRGDSELREDLSEGHSTVRGLRNIWAPISEFVRGQRRAGRFRFPQW